MVLRLWKILVAQGLCSVMLGLNYSSSGEYFSVRVTIFLSLSCHLYLGLVG